MDSLHTLNTKITINSLTVLKITAIDAVLYLIYTLLSDLAHPVPAAGS